MTDKNWIRDHVHVMKAMRHWEYDLKSFLDFIIETQRKDGQFYELIKQVDDKHWSFVNEDCYVMYPEDNLSLVRLELEADIEYLVAGHHGSKSSTSKELLDALTPETVCISVGSNSYGHPADETLRRLAEHGCTVYRTDLHGDIHLLMNQGDQHGIREETEK